MRIPVLKDCSVEGCREVALTKGLCRKHYQAVKRAEKIQAKPDEPRRAGGSAA